MNRHTENMDLADFKKELDNRMIKTLKENNKHYLLIFFGAVLCEVSIFCYLYLLNWQFNGSLIVSILTCTATMYITVSSYVKGKKELKRYYLN